MIDSDFNEENNSDVRPSTEPPGDTERTNSPQRFILRVLERVFSIEFVAFIQTFSYGLHSVIRLVHCCYIFFISLCVMDFIEGPT